MVSEELHHVWYKDICVGSTDVVIRFQFTDYSFVEDVGILTNAIRVDLTTDGNPTISTQDITFTVTISMGGSNPATRGQIIVFPINLLSIILQLLQEMTFGKKMALLPTT